MSDCNNATWPMITCMQRDANGEDQHQFVLAALLTVFVILLVVGIAVIILLRICNYRIQQERGDAKTPFIRLKSKNLLCAADPEYVYGTRVLDGHHSSQTQVNSGLGSSAKAPLTMSEISDDNVFIEKEETNSAKIQRIGDAKRLALPQRLPQRIDNHLLAMWPKQTRYGSLQYTMEYDAVLECLTVTILTGRGLRHAHCSTFVTVHLLPFTKSQHYLAKCALLLTPTIIKLQPPLTAKAAVRCPSSSSCVRCKDFDMKEAVKHYTTPWRTRLIINDRNPNFNERISFSAIQKSSLAIAYLSVVVKTVFTETDHKANYSKSLPSAAFANAPKSLMGRAICPVSKNLKQGLQWLELHQVLPFQYAPRCTTAGEVYVAVQRYSSIIMVHVECIRHLPPKHRATTYSVCAKVKFLMPRGGGKYTVGSRKSRRVSLDPDMGADINLACHLHTDKDKMADIEVLVEIKEHEASMRNLLISDLLLSKSSRNKEVLSFWNDAVVDDSSLPTGECEWSCKNHRWLHLEIPPVP